ncbi:hypothetical protein DVH24_027510, partial [Malus domestica]
HHDFVSGNSHKNFTLGHPSWECSCANSLNFGVLMESETNELPKGLVLGRDGNIHIRLRGSTPLGNECSHANSLNFGVPMEPEANELLKGLVLGRDGNIHIRLRGCTPLDDVECYRIAHPFQKLPYMSTLQIPNDILVKII